MADHKQSDRIRYKEIPLRKLNSIDQLLTFVKTELQKEDVCSLRIDLEKATIGYLMSEEDLTEGVVHDALELARRAEHVLHLDLAQPLDDRLTALATVALQHGKCIVAILCPSFHAFTEHFKIPITPFFLARPLDTDPKPSIFNAPLVVDESLQDNAVVLLLGEDSSMTTLNVQTTIVVTIK